MTGVDEKRDKSGVARGGRNTKNERNGATLAEMPELQDETVNSGLGFFRPQQNKTKQQNSFLFFFQLCFFFFFSWFLYVNPCPSLYWGSKNEKWAPNERWPLNLDIRLVEHLGHEVRLRFVSGKN